MSSDFVGAVRALLVPLAPENEPALLEHVRSDLDGRGVAEADQANWLRVELNKWREEGVPSTAFKALMKAAIYQGGPPSRTLMFATEAIVADDAWLAMARRLSERYFDTHADLVSRYLLDHDFARQLLAQSAWMARLAATDRMSASEICRLIGARDSRLLRRWDVVQKILSGLGVAPLLSLAEVQDTYRQDVEAEPELLGDLNQRGSIDFTAKTAKGLGCDGELSEWLTDLIVTDLHDPYLLILHYQMIIQEHHEHPPTFAYEFKPRGQAVEWLAQQYRDAGIPVAQNAFLNNAKATLRFDSGWVAGRTDHARAARGMASILAAMESLGGLARKEIASRIRALLRRHIRLREQADGPLPHTLPALDAAQLGTLFNAIAAANSSTTGIAEQRLVDAFGVSRHPKAEGWAYRGLGDSVFAPNLPRRKCGDCEFELALQAGPAIRAYEAHGGTLSPVYVEDHLRTLTAILGQRSEDLSAVAPIGDWSIQVVFVSHGTVGVLPDELLVETPFGQASVALEYMTFAAAADELLASPDLVEITDEHFRGRLNSEFVHPRVRERVIGLLQ